jgi:hypothetical protein
VHTVLETEAFARAAKAAGISEEDRLRIVTTIAENPRVGDLIPGTGGARKLRIAKAGRGKRAGYRIITYYAAEDVPVFLLDIFAKGEKVDLSQAERNELRKALSTIADDYRRSVHQNRSEYG